MAKENVDVLSFVKGGTEYELSVNDKAKTDLSNIDETGKEEIKKIAESVTPEIDIATTEKVGVVKPDGETIEIDEDGTIRMAKPKNKIMTVKVDLSDSNPATCCSYADDAESMTPGSDEWDEFFGFYPCLLKGGKEVGKLNPSNFAQFENGSSADITSGNAGDVMIAFPRRGLKMFTNGNILTVSMTDDTDNPDFKYYAHIRGTARKDVFYIGAYHGFEVSGKLRSLSGKTPTTNVTIGNYRTKAQANGTGYDQWAHYQHTFIQAMYLLKFANLDSQTAVGRGYVDGNSAVANTGINDTKGMQFGETTGKIPMKLFGIENLWGNLYTFLDGIYYDNDYNVLTATDGFNDTGNGYRNCGKGASANVGGYMTKPQGNTEMGFTPKESAGSENTFFCDYGSLGAGRIVRVGGGWSTASIAGVFCRDDATVSYASASCGARIMFL